MEDVYTVSRVNPTSDVYWDVKGPGGVLLAMASRVTAVNIAAKLNAAYTLGYLHCMQGVGKRVRITDTGCYEIPEGASHV